MMRPLVWLLAMLPLLAACPSDEPSGELDCEQSTLSYQNFGASFMSDYCTTCHSVSLTGSDRNLAPAGIDFDEHADVLARAGRVQVRTIDLGSMPPLRSPQPSAAELADLSEWLSCGAP